MDVRFPSTNSHGSPLSLTSIPLKLPYRPMEVDLLTSSPVYFQPSRGWSHPDFIPPRYYPILVPCSHPQGAEMKWALRRGRRRPTGHPHPVQKSKMGASTHSHRNIFTSKFSYIGSKLYFKIIITQMKEEKNNFLIACMELLPNSAPWK